MPRPESNIHVTQGGFVPTQRTPELVAPAVRDYLSFSGLSQSEEPGYAIYNASAFGIDLQTIQEAAQEFGPDNNLLQPAEDSRIGFEHRTFYANLSRQTAILHDFPATQFVLDSLTSFIQTQVARHSEFALRGGRHAGLAAWTPSVIAISRRQLAGDAEGGRAAFNSFVPGQFERSSDKNQVLSARITLDGDQQVEILRDGATRPRAAHIGAAQLLLSREIGLVAGDEPVRGPSFRMRIPTDQLTLTVYNQRG